ITPRQLALHDKATDAWIAIRGKVYNVTQYLPFHPGGPDELMRGIGKDATSLFDQAALKLFRNKDSSRTAHNDVISIYEVYRNKHETGILSFQA
ncbi:hypothetical protein ILUMI_08567, partial [Ignelater luminosus]